MEGDSDCGTGDGSGCSALWRFAGALGVEDGGDIRLSSGPCGSGPIPICPCSWTAGERGTPKSSITEFSASTSRIKSTALPYALIGVSRTICAMPLRSAISPTSSQSASSGGSRWGERHARSLGLIRWAISDKAVKSSVASSGRASACLRVHHLIIPAISGSIPGATSVIGGISMLALW